MRDAGQLPVAGHSHTRVWASQCSPGFTFCLFLSPWCRGIMYLLCLSCLPVCTCGNKGHRANCCRRPVLMDGQLGELLKKLFLPGEVSQDISCTCVRLFIHLFRSVTLKNTRPQLSELSVVLGRRGKENKGKDQPT